MKNEKALGMAHETHWRGRGRPLLGKRFCLSLGVLLVLSLLFWQEGCSFQNQGDVVGVQVTDDGTNTTVLTTVEIISKSGPTPVYSDYYMQMVDGQKRYPLQSVLNFFLKYIDEAYLEIPPDLLKKIEYTQPTDAPIVLPGLVEGAGTYQTITLFF